MSRSFVSLSIFPVIVLVFSPIRFLKNSAVRGSPVPWLASDETGAVPLATSMDSPTWPTVLGASEGACPRPAVFSPRFPPLAVSLDWAMVCCGVLFMSGSLVGSRDGEAERSSAVRLGDLFLLLSPFSASGSEGGVVKTRWGSRGGLESELRRQPNSRSVWASSAAPLAGFEVSSMSMLRSDQDRQGSDHRQGGRKWPVSANGPVSGPPR